jgi:hypothetical protein
LKVRQAIDFVGRCDLCLEQRWIMPDVIQALFCNPPIAIARLGASTAPLVAYTWVLHANARNDSDTGIVPDWSFEVMTDGSLTPVLPDEVRFRDGMAIRPVCPFIELWARVGEEGSDASTWRDTPLTEELLAQQELGLKDLSFKIDARNAKVARRTANPALAYGLFPSIELTGDHHELVPLEATSPPGVATPMIPTGRSIPFGAVQICKPTPNPANAPWPPSIDLSIVRLRFTPAVGAFYGPPQAAQSTPESVVPAVPVSNAFLSDGAGWFKSNGAGGGFVIPADTFDFLVSGDSPQALGVIDDTCEARIEVSLLSRARTAPTAASAVILVAPPDFAPDRRPFVSIADDLNDRSSTSVARNGAMNDGELELWVQDLFQRVYETVSLMNVDFWRSARGLRGLSGNRLAPTPIQNDAITPLDQALGGQDALRNRLERVAAPTSDQPLPIGEHAREKHRSISDLDQLRELVGLQPTRLRQLIRGAFEAEQGEDGSNTTMRMPPFMRASNANPLTLVGWQYDLVMRWADAVSSAQPAVAVAAAARTPGALSPLSERSAARQRRVLANLA